MSSTTSTKWSDALPPDWSSTGRYPPVSHPARDGPDLVEAGRQVGFRGETSRELLVADKGDVVDLGAVH